MILQQNRPLNSPQPTPRHSHQHRTLRQKLLDQIRRQVRSQLEQSLHLAVPQHPSDSTPNKRLCDIQIKINGSPTQQLEPTTSYLEVFQQSLSTLLILGLPGAGKTTTLLRLSLELIAQSFLDSANPIPIIINLISWQPPPNSQTIPFTTWLINQLQLHYAIPAPLGQTWLKSGEIILLLDGLDQLAPSWQQHAIIEINQLLLDNPTPLQIAITSRLEEYKSCKTRLRVNGALWLQPLTDTQIREYLYAAKSRELWQAIRSDPPLLDVARTPLNLVIMALADEDILIHAWRRLESHQERQTYLLQAFIRRMLGCTGATKTRETPLEITRHSLSSLAHWMQRHRTHEFVIEAIQPGDFLTPRQQQRYFWELGVLMALLVGCLSFGIIALVYNPMLALYCSLPLAILYGWIGYQRNVDASYDWLYNSFKLDTSSPAFGETESTQTAFSESELLRTASPSLGFTDQDVSGRIREQRDRISPTPNHPWSSKSKTLAPWTNWRTVQSDPPPICQQLTYTLFKVPAIAIIIGLIVTFSLTFIAPDFSKVAGFCTGLILLLLLATPSAKQVLAHFWLRHWLSRLKILPWNLNRFLDTATQRLLLKKIGRRYQFMHESLQNLLLSK